MTTLLQRVEDFLAAGNLLDGYTIRHRRWLDLDLQQNGQVILFRETGTAGPSDYCVQKPRVTISMLTDPDAVESGRERMREINQRFYTNYKSADVVMFVPIGTISGVSYLENDRGLFRLTVECIVQDQ